MEEHLLRLTVSRALVALRTSLLVLEGCLQVAVSLAKTMLAVTKILLTFQHQNLSTIW